MDGVVAEPDVVAMPKHHQASASRLREHAGEGSVIDAYRGDLAETGPREVECADQLLHPIVPRYTRISLTRQIRPWCRPLARPRSHPDEDVRATGVAERAGRRFVRTQQTDRWIDDKRCESTARTQHGMEPETASKRARAH